MRIRGESIVIDTSAIIAILQGEDDAPALADAISRAGYRLLSAVSQVEASVVCIARRRSAAEVDAFIERAAIEIVPVTSAHAELAIEGFKRFGKGRHAAALNFGDCFSYALARATGHPLLYKGHDFVLTDVVSVAPRVTPR